MRRCRKMISMIMLMVMLVSLLPSGALAAEAPADGTNEVTAVEMPQGTADVTEGEDLKGESIKDEGTDKSEEIPANTSISDVKEEVPVEDGTNGASKDEASTDVVKNENPTDGTENSGVNKTTTEIAPEVEPTDGGTENAGTGESNTDIVVVVEPTEQTVEDTRLNASSVDMKTFMDEVVNGQPRGKISVTLKDKNGMTVGTDGQTVTVKPGDNYTLDYHIQVGPAGIPSGTIAYTNLPGNVNYGTAGGVLKDDGGNSIGTWSLNSNGRLEFNFSGTSTVQDCAFTAHFGLSFQSVSAELDLDDLHIIIDPSASTEKGLKKTGTKANGGRIKWTVTLTNKGGATSVGTTVTETLSNDYDDHSFKDADKADGILIEAIDPEGNKQTSWTATSPAVTWVSNSQWKYTIPESMNGITFGPDWDFILSFYSTRALVGTGVQTYRNKVTTSDNRTCQIDQQISNVVGTAKKTGNLDASGGAFNWTIKFDIVDPLPTDYYQLYDALRFTLVGQAGGNGLYWGKLFEQSSNSWRPIPGSMVVTFTPVSGEVVTITEFAQGSQTSGLCYRITETHNPTSELDYQWQLDLGHYTSAGGFSEQSDLMTEGFITVSYQTPYDAEVMQGLLNQTTYNDDVNTVRNVTYINKNNKRQWNLNASVEIDQPEKKIVERPDEDNEYVETFSIEFIPPADLAADTSHQLIIDSLTVTDTMSEYLFYIPGSLVLTATDFVTGEEVSVDQPEIDQQGNVLNITINNPSKYKYKIVYQAKVNTAKALRDQISDIPTNNEFDIKVGDAVVSAEVKDTCSDWNHIATAFHINIEKVDEAGSPLAGAKFGLYAADGTKFRDASDVVTDEEGKGVFETDVDKFVYFARNTLYYVAEIDAPEGYKVNTKKYWFVIDDSTFNAENRKTEDEWKELIPEGEEFEFMTGKTITFTIENVPNNTSISGQKTWAYDNPDLRPASITVKLLANGEEVQGKSVIVTPDQGGNWKYEFTDLPVSDADGTITYSVKEDPVPSGYTAKYNGNDILNEYNATGKTTLNGSKKIENRNFKAGDKWTFKLSAVTEGAPMPAKTTVEINPTSGTSADFSFGDISFKLADMGGAKEKTFEYKIEESGTVAGVVNDSKTHTVSVKVTDDGKGKLNAVNTYKDGTATNNQKAEFVNEYKPGDVTYNLKGVKTLTGRAFAEGDKWTFTVTAEAGTPMPAKTEVVIEPTSGTTADIDFGTIKYGLANAGKTYTYTVTETGTIAGVTNDPKNVKTVKVKVEDDGQGNLTATATEDSQKVEYKNTYNATGKTTLNGSKTIENREFKEGDKWTFKVSAVTEGAPMPAKTTVEINPTNGTSTDFSFGDINFKLADMAGAKEKTFEYKIEESGTVAGVVNDSKTHTVSVKVTDDGKGKLVAVKTYTDGDKTNNEKAEFVNTYGADGTYQLKGVKTLTGRAFAEGDKWTFTVTAEAGTPMPAKTEVVIEPTSGTTADIDFGTIKYGLANAGKTYTYTVTETGTIAGVTNDPKNVKTVKVKVEDNGQGKLTATPTEDSQKVEYKNTYDATGKTTLDGSKTIENREFKEGDKWTFKVSAVTEGAPMPAKTTVEINPTSGTSTDFSFGDISFKLADMAGAKEKTFEYKIEESGTIKGVSNDGGSHTVSVKVTDDGKGHLDAVNTYTDGEIKNNEKSKFVNVYSAKGEYTLTGTKTIAGRNFQEGDKWTFTVTAEEGTPMPEKTEVVIEPTSGTTADIDFGTIKYSLANAGKTYTYTVTETGTIAGVTNDTANVKTVKIKVEDDGEGGLTATATEDSDAVAFTNTYNATGSIELPGKKVLENRSFREGDKWTFTIEAKDGAPLPTETSVEVTPEAGETEEEFSIGTINYVLSDLGGLDTRTFEYTITETGTVSGVVNDIKNTRTVKVEVTDKKDGNLEAVLTEDSEEVTFTNTHISFSKQDVDGKEIKDATIQILDESGTVIDEWKSEEDKSHEVEELEAGKKYTMHEVSAPDGFTVTTDIVFIVDEDYKVKVIDQTTDGKTEVKDGKVIMTDKKTKVTFSKQDVDGTEIGGAEIQILDEEGKPVDSWTSVEGESHELEGLVTGKKYTMHEVSAPDGFTVATDIIFTIDTDGTVKVIDQATDGETIVEDGRIIMTDKKTKVTFSKQDVGGIEIGGAKIQILDEEGNVVDEWTSVEGESHELEGLVTGKKYTMHEVSAPDGFVVATDITFTIDTDGTVKVIDQSTDGETIVENGKVIMTDEKSTVKFSKVDTESGAELEGAKLQILDEDGKVVEEWISTKDVHVVEGLKTGKKYILRELVAPLGYTLTTDTVFSIDDHNVVTSSGPVNKDGVILIEDTITEVDILKVDSKTGKGLKGAKLQVLDDNGNVCDEWTSTKDAHKIKGLYTGVKYTLHEVEAPKGYDKAKDITFTIDTAGKVSSDALENGVIVMKDTPSPSKSKNKTGDSANGALWALLLLMAGGALGGTVWYKRRKKV